MQVLQLFFITSLLWKVDLKAVDKKYDVIFPQDTKTLYDYSTNYVPKQRKSYIPLIDGQPILIPEEFAQSEDLKEDSPHGLENSVAPSLQMDEVFPVDQKKGFKQKSSILNYPQKLIEEKVSNDEYKEMEKDLQKPKQKSKKKMCKVSKNKIKKVTETNKKLVTNTKKAQSSLNEKDNEIGLKVPQNVSNDSSQRNIFNTNENKEFFDEHHTLQEEVKSMFGPSFKSFVFNPLAPPKSKFQECNTSKNESGLCRYVQHCFLPSIVSSIQQFMNNICIIQNRFIGVCCPDFPIQTVFVKWKDGQQSFDDNESSDQIKTPEECGVGTNTRIVGGSDANVKAWPWMVALLNNKKEFFCGGSLINNRYVLTAAHCTFGLKNDELIARVGEYDLRSDEGEDHRVIEIKRHGQYNRFTLRNDVALLKLEKPVVFNEFVQTVCFPEEAKNYTGKIATLAGWGRLQGGVSPFTSDVLQEVDFPIVTNEECSSTHGLPIPESLICTSAPSKDKSACNGDSGGPLMMLDDENRWKVVGIVSWGRRGCNTKFPSVFTRVTHFLDWIKHYAV